MTMTVAEVGFWRASCNNRVSFEFRYGTWVRLQSRSEAMHWASVERDMLMLATSDNCEPFCNFSDPARSTRLNRTAEPAMTEPSLRKRSTVTWKSAWLRDDVEFTPLSPTARLATPNSKSSKASSKLLAQMAVRPGTITEPPAPSRTSKPLRELGDPPRRSKTCSLYISMKETLTRQFDPCRMSWSYSDSRALGMTPRSAPMRS
mmetsp:Transcript_24689/g.65668  ORF Transcript_24689/g.65668 Transcript_24689/m.65668 type:complete len:204 (+) Transcript_24689:1104-1715(+)